jgi:hypothetical protein
MLKYLKIYDQNIQKNILSCWFQAARNVVPYLRDEHRIEDVSEQSAEDNF